MHRRIESHASFNPFRVDALCRFDFQGSSCLATLGWMISIPLGLTAETIRLRLSATPHHESQRDSIIQPMVDASQERLPWVCAQRIINHIGVVSTLRNGSGCRNVEYQYREMQFSVSIVFVAKNKPPFGLANLPNHSFEGGVAFHCWSDLRQDV